MVELLLFCIVALVALIFVKNKPSDVGQYPDGVKPAEGEEIPSSGHGHGHRDSSSGSVYYSPVDWKVSDAMKTGAFWLIIEAGVSFMMTSPLLWRMASFIYRMSV